MYYSSSNNGFFSGSSFLLPSDAVAITSDDWGRLMSGQTSGLMIVAGEDGYPVLKDRPPLSTEQLMEIERDWRNGVLALTDALVSRHRDELEEGPNTTLTDQQYAGLQVYRRALRNWPEVDEFPLRDHRPLEPFWLTAQLQ